MSENHQDPEQLFCADPDCIDPKTGFPRPVDRLGYCASHRKQKQRTGSTEAIAERVSDDEKLINLYDKVANADADADYDRAMRSFKAELKRQRGGGKLTAEQVEAGVQKALEALRLRRAAAVRAGMLLARKKGKHVGRPPKVATEELRRVFEVLRAVSQGAGVVRATARLLNLNPGSVSRRLSLRKGTLLQQVTPSPAA